MQKHYEITVGSISYKDTEEHFENGLLRLLAMDRATFERWLGCANDNKKSLLENLSYGFATIRHQTLPPRGHSIDNGILNMPGELWRSLDEPYHIIKSLDGSIAWLAKSANSQLQREIEPPIYEENYFEGDPKEDGGYGKYTEQASWRLEKASRQLNEIYQTVGLKSGKALDVGSGYGYFRRALDIAGWEHSGVEISTHARNIAKSMYGYDTYSDMLNPNLSQYDLITLWDVIEHIADPIAYLSDIVKYLRPGGVLAIKTPNINCPEADIFGSHYHSLKREHLVYFTDRSLQAITLLVGLSTHTITSVSHLLQGFVGKDTVQQWATQNRGADLIGYFINN